MRTIAVTGSASGIGAAIRTRLARDGARIIGIDLRNADIVADLSTAAGRAAAIAEVERMSKGALDGLVACAGLGPQVPDQPAIASVNYFGAQNLLTQLRPALARGTQPAAVAISSNSSTVPGAESPLVAACLEGNEANVREMALTLAGHQVYAGSKLALTRWLRRVAPTADWAGVGIRLNAVAPGPIMTPLLQAGLDHPVLGPAIRAFPIPVGEAGTPDDIAVAVAFLMSPEARFICGSVLFVDGGTDALIRGDQY